MREEDRGTCRKAQDQTGRDRKILETIRRYSKRCKELGGYIYTGRDERMDVERYITRAVERNWCKEEDTG